jgi:mannose-6-phosphate isomerase-like protein (cupin superfamily)
VDYTASTNLDGHVCNSCDALAASVKTLAASVAKTLQFGMRIHHLSDLQNEHRPYVELLRTSNLSMGLYRLRAGASDDQRPHREEEIYYVLAGRARLLAGKRDVPVKSGDVLLVSANEQHKFYDIEEDLELLVFFAPPEGSQ